MLDKIAAAWYNKISARAGTVWPSTRRLKKWMKKISAGVPPLLTCDQSNHPVGSSFQSPLHVASTFIYRKVGLRLAVVGLHRQVLLRHLAPLASHSPCLYPSPRVFSPDIIIIPYCLRKVNTFFKFFWFFWGQASLSFFNPPQAVPTLLTRNRVYSALFASYNLAGVVSQSAAKRGGLM